MNGGARDGAGRKAKGYKAMTIRLPEADIKILGEVGKELGISRGEVVHNMITDYIERAENQ